MQPTTTEVSGGEGELTPIEQTNRLTIPSSRLLIDAGDHFQTHSVESVDFLFVEILWTIENKVEFGKMGQMRLQDFR